MKKILVAAGTLLFTLNANALSYGVKFVNHDGTEDTQMCIDAIYDKSIKVDDNIACNGLKMSNFVKEYRNRISGLNPSEDVTVKVISLEPKDDSLETSLCIAAATNESKYNSLLEKNKINTNKIICNGLPIRKFARNYKNKNVVSQY